MALQEQHSKIISKSQLNIWTLILSQQQGFKENTQEMKLHIEHVLAEAKFWLTEGDFNPCGLSS